MLRSTCVVLFFFFKPKTAFGVSACLVGSEMCIRDRLCVSMGGEFDPDADEESKEGKPSRQYLKDEVLACAKKLGSLGGSNLWGIDTSLLYTSDAADEEDRMSCGGSRSVEHRRLT